LPQGEASWSGGTALYTPEEHSIGKPADCSHDLYALAATMHHVVFDRLPFWYGGEKLRDRGVDWNGVNRSDLQWIPEFVDKATSANVTDRFSNAMQALKWIKQRVSEGFSFPLAWQ
jgi:hypothetical protein